MSAKEALENILRKLPADRRADFRRDSVWIVCPNKEHSGGHEKTPSFKVATEGEFFGSYYCYGCKIHGNLKQLATLLGLGPEVKSLAVTHPYELYSAEEEAEMTGKTESASALVTEEWDPADNWRGIDGHLIVAVGGRLLIPERANDQPHLVLPVFVREKQRGYVKCTTRPKRDGFDYINAGGKSWSKSVLFPYDYVRARLDERSGERVVAVVEGSRDALQTIQNGLLALATLGATSWDAKCVKLIKALAVDRVVILADPDDAGEKLAADVRRDLRDFCETTRIRLPNKMETVVKNGVSTRRRVKLKDPADLSRVALRKVLDRAGLSDIELERMDRLENAT